MKRTLDPNFKGGVCSSYDEVIGWNEIHKNLTLRILPEHLYSFNCVFYFRKNSPYVSAFDRLTSLYKSAGLIEFWKTKYLDTASIMPQITQKLPTKLNLDQLGGCFQLFSFGLILSFFAFIGEVFSRGKIFLKKFSNSSFKNFKAAFKK